MPTVYNVSDITRILSGIIKNEPALQEVSVTGKVSVDNLLGVFWLRDGENKIRCFIPGGPGGNMAKFGFLLEAENTVVVNGRITLFPSESEYQIRVADVLPIIKLPKVNQQLTVSGITASLSSLMQNSSDLQKVQVHGNISNFDSNRKRAFWFLSDTNIVNPQRIHCVFFEADEMAIGNGDQVRAEGKIQIWGTHSRYQINIAELQLDDGTPRCECSECKSCRPLGAKCNRTRNPKYELCSPCYAVSPDHEKRVEEAVETYFFSLNVKEFSPKTQHEIQIGSENRRPDVVLADENGSFAAIAECKGAGYVGHGIEQLKSYLSATDTRFGIFANRTDPEQWGFYENRRRNRFDQIDRSEFEAGVVKGIATRERFKNEIKALEKAKDDLENKKSELETEIAQLMQTERDLQGAHKQLISEIGKKRVQQGELETEIGKLAKTEYDLQDTHKQLRKEIEATTQQHAGLKQEITEVKKPEIRTENRNRSP